MRIAFDLDGTLLDSIEHIHASVSRALAELALPAIDRATTQGFVGLGLPNLISQVLTHLSEPASRHAELSEHVMAHYIRLPSRPESVFPGVHAALDKLTTQGHHLSLCTNKPFKAALRVLSDTGLARHFDLVVGGDSLPRRKPAPDMLTACAPDLFVGDSETDAATAQSAALPFLLYTEGYRKTPITEIPHDHSFDDFAHLPTLVSKYPRGGANAV